MNKKTWTKGEHDRFMFGLKMYGKGNWAKIAKKCVLTRTPTQVASHAQKYYERSQRPRTTTRRRKSIFDDQVQVVYKPLASYPTADWYKKYCIM